MKELFKKRAATETKGHSLSQGGLRGHSIGEHYPISVMYEGIIGQGRWVVWNALTGMVIGKYITSKEAHSIVRWFVSRKGS